MNDVNNWNPAVCRMVINSIVNDVPRVKPVRHVVLIWIENYNEWINKRDKKRERLTSFEEKWLRFAQRGERWKRDSFYSFRLTVDRSTPISFSHTSWRLIQWNPYTQTLKQKNVLKGRFWSRADYWDNMKETILGKAVLRERDGPYKGGLWSRFQLYT